MKRGSATLTLRCLLVALLFFAVPFVQGAKPTGGGGGGAGQEAVAVDPPELFWASFHHVDRQLRLQGRDLVTGDPAAPVFPQLFIGGAPVDIDEPASIDATDFTTNEGAVLVSFASLLDALADPGPAVRALEGGDNYVIKAVTATGTAQLSIYFAGGIKDVPEDTGSCPCAADFALLYQRGEGLPEATFCSSTQGIDPAEYIEDGYGKSDGSAVIIGSHSSWSSEPLYTSSCYVRDLGQTVSGVEEPRYLAGPQPVGNGDHLLCVEQIKLLEPNCEP